MMKISAQRSSRSALLIALVVAGGTFATIAAVAQDLKDIHAARGKSQQQRLAAHLESQCPPPNRDEACRIRAAKAFFDAETAFYEASTAEHQKATAEHKINIECLQTLNAGLTSGRIKREDVRIALAGRPLASVPPCEIVDALTKR